MCHQEAAAALTVVWGVTLLGTLLFHTSGWMSGEEIDTSSLPSPGLGLLPVPAEKWLEGPPKGDNATTAKWKTETALLKPRIPWNGYEPVTL